MELLDRGVAFPRVAFVAIAFTTLAGTFPEPDEHEGFAEVTVVCVTVVDGLVRAVPTGFRSALEHSGPLPPIPFLERGVLRSRLPLRTLRIGFRNRFATPRCLCSFACIESSFVGGREIIELNVLFELEAWNRHRGSRVLRQNTFGNADSVPNFIVAPCHTTDLEVFRPRHCLLEFRFHSMFRPLCSLPVRLTGCSVGLQVSRIYLYLP